MNRSFREYKECTLDKDPLFSETLTLQCADSYPMDSNELCFLKNSLEKDGIILEYITGIDKIFSLCYETYPCKHTVVLNFGDQKMTGLLNGRVLKLLMNHFGVRDKHSHFANYKIIC